MSATTEQLNTFISLYRKEYNIELTDEQANKEISKLFQLYKLVYKKNEKYKSKI